MSDTNTIAEVSKLAFEQYERGQITFQQLIAVQELCVNATALTNGYDELHGLPFPEDES